MTKISKYIKLNPNVLMDWTFDNENYNSYPYKIITNINENKKRIFVSKNESTKNTLSNNLFQLDTVLRKYTILDPSKYNFLQEQDYETPPILYDKVKIYLPTNYNFIEKGYVGMYIKIYTYNYYNEKTVELSNIFFDATDSGKIISMSLNKPFMYDEKEWGKYYEFSIPSIDYISNQRQLDDNNISKPIENTLNYNLFTGEGLSQTSPIFVSFQFLTTKDIVLGNTYYYGSDITSVSFSKTPEYNTLAVQIKESTEGDFFEIYGVYGESNENLDNFISELENKGRRVRIEYDVYLYEENIQTSKQTFSVIGGDNDSFSKKILYRPILIYSNTTAAINVVMRIIDLVDMSSIERASTIGLTNNVQKYGKKLISLNIQNLNKLKIYNSKPDEIVLSKDYFSTNVITEIVKVNSPQLIEVGKMILNSTSSIEGYKGMGLLNIIITPFDNIIKFGLYKLPDISSYITSEQQLIPYDLSNIVNNSEIMLIFKSDSETLEKPIYKDADNNFKNGEIYFKILEKDVSTLKRFYNKGFNNFYLVLYSNSNPSSKKNNYNNRDGIKTMLYSGVFSFLDDIRFNDNNLDGIGDISDDSYYTDYNVSDGVDNTNDTGNNNNEDTQNNEYQPIGKTVIIYTKYKDTSINSN